MDAIKYVVITANSRSSSVCTEQLCYRDYVCVVNKRHKYRCSCDIQIVKSVLEIPQYALNFLFVYLCGMCMELILQMKKYL